MEGNTLQVTQNSADSNQNQTNIISNPSSSANSANSARELKLAPQPKAGVAPGQESDPWAFRIKVGLVFFAVLWLLLVGAMWSRAANADDNSSVESSDKNGSEYSFKWLDPEKKIYVLQNRRYLKADHLMISAMAGPGFSNPYRSTFSFEPRLAYYFSEDWGFELFYKAVSNSNNNTYNAMIATNSNIFPVIREIKSEFGGLIHWVPWYAKINVFNTILYFDWYFAGGVGEVNSQVTSTNSSGGTDKTQLSNFVTQDEMGLFLATGHQYHLNETFTVRLDFMGAYYRAPLTGQTGDKVWFTDYDFTFGLGIRL